MHEAAEDRSLHSLSQACNQASASTLIALPQAVERECSVCSSTSACAASIRDGSSRQLLFNIHSFPRLTRSMQVDFSGRVSKRLLDAQTYRSVFDSDTLVRTYPPYAILSHRWSDDEIEFPELTHAQDLDTSSDPRWAKIRAACSIAQRHGIRWLWSDTSCINTSHPSEKNNAINSMFEFYEEAAICITYSPDVSYRNRDPVNADTFRRADQANLYSEWFERGRTLQELLAPRNMKFYDKDWTLVETKSNLSQALSAILESVPPVRKAQRAFEMQMSQQSSIGKQSAGLHDHKTCCTAYLESSAST